MAKNKKKHELEVHRGAYVMISPNLLTKEQIMDENRVFKVERKIHTPLVEVDKKCNVTSLILFEGTFTTDQTIALISQKDIIEFAKREEVQKAKERLLTHMRMFEFTSCLKALEKRFHEVDISVLLGIINADP
jgi:hypothetical protein